MLGIQILTSAKILGWYVQQINTKSWNGSVCKSCLLIIASIYHYHLLFIITTRLFSLCIAGFFYWMKSVQTYDSGWNYLENLKNFVAGGMNDSSFIDAVSGIVNRGCHNPPCPNGLGQLDGGYERSENFKKVLRYVTSQLWSSIMFKSCLGGY